MKVPTDQGEICAGFFPRAGAYIADCFIVGVMTSGFSMIIGFVESMWPDGVIFNNILFSFNIFDILNYLCILAYFVLFLCVTGTTPGKRMFNLAVVNEKGFKPTFFEALYRESIGRFLSSMCMFGYIMIFIDKKNRSFHDYLCDTLVVYTVKLHKVYKDGKVIEPSYDINLKTAEQQVPARPQYDMGMQQSRVGYGIGRPSEAQPGNVGMQQSPNMGYGMGRPSESQPGNTGMQQSPNTGYGIGRPSESQPGSTGMQQSLNMGYGIGAPSYTKPVSGYESTGKVMFNEAGVPLFPPSRASKGVEEPIQSVEEVTALGEEESKQSVEEATGNKEEEQKLTAEGVITQE